MDLVVKITKKYKDFTLAVNMESHGKALGLLGASGSGKSLTLRCLAGIETADQGYIRLNDRVLFDSQRGINISPRNRNIGLLFQSYALFPHMTVIENIKIAMKDRIKSRQRLERLLAMFSLENLQHRYPWQLSGGEQQRVAMARVLAYEPELLLLDEPFSALDSRLKELIFPELKLALSEYGRELIMVSHSKGELYQFCDSLAVLEQGAMVEYGSRDRIFARPQKAATARLIGCSNISRARRTAEYELMALDWGLSLRTRERVTEDIRFVGIFARNLRLANHAGENSMQAELLELLEGQEELKLFFRRPGHSDKKHMLQLALSKAGWNKHSLNGRMFLHFPAESLLLLK